MTKKTKNEKVDSRGGLKEVDKSWTWVFTQQGHTFLVPSREEQNLTKQQIHPNWRSNWCKVDEISEAKLCRSFPEKFANIKFAEGVPRKKTIQQLRNFNWILENNTSLNIARLVTQIIWKLDLRAKNLFLNIWW